MPERRSQVSVHDCLFLSRCGSFAPKVCRNTGSHSPDFTLPRVAQTAPRTVVFVSATFWLLIVVPAAPPVPLISFPAAPPRLLSLLRKITPLRMPLLLPPGDSSWRRLRNGSARANSLVWMVMLLRAHMPRCRADTVAKRCILRAGPQVERTRSTGGVP